MARPKSTVPAYKLHSSTGLARCWVHGRWVTLGRYGSPESRQEHARILAELAAADPAPAAAITSRTSPEAAATIDQVILAFLGHAEAHYRGRDGKPTNEFREFKRSFVHLHRTHGHTPAAAFGPRALALVREGMVGEGWCRRLVNQRVARIVRAFKWATAQELVPVTAYTALRTLAGLQKGRTKAPESERVLPVDPAHVAATLPRLGAHLRCMAELQLLTGMRPGEACALTLGEVDRGGAVWLYRPADHKTSHRGRERVIPLGPKARAVLVAFLLRDGVPPAGFEPPAAGDDTARLVLADAYQEAGRGRDAELLRDLGRAVEFVAGCVVDPEAPVFSPTAAREERFRAARRRRKSKVQPSHASRRKAAPKLTPAAAYTPHTYAHAVRVAAEKAGAPHWHPNQLRHTFATEVRKAHGLEAAQVLLGHARADVTQVYSERNLALAVQVAAVMG